MSSAHDTAETTSCANCSKSEDGDVKLKRCTACKMVKYCCQGCQISHRPKHKRACKKRAAELFDEELFKDPPAREECPICMLPLPIDASEIIFAVCCGNFICVGCSYAQQIEELKSGKRVEDVGWCPFCRAPPPRAPEDNISLLNKCIEKNNAKAINELAAHYMKGEIGLPINPHKATELFLKAVQLGHAGACFNLGNCYLIGNGVERDEKKARQYWELGAIKGNVQSRHQLGCLEQRSGNLERAYKHVMISAKAGDDLALKSLNNGFRDGFVTKDEYTEALKAYQKVQDDTKSEMRDAAKIYWPK